MQPAGSSAASAPDVVFCDGLGERRLIRDRSGTVRELLCIRAELSATPLFEQALIDRFRRLSSFRHPYFVPACAVERLPDAARSLALVSERFNGIRLTQLLPRIAQRGVRLDIDTTVFWLRQLLEALARLHESSRALAHGALGPDRVILTSNGRLMVTEHTLGAALEQLAYPADRYWRELRIPLLRSSQVRRLDQRTDVAQVGVLALSLVLGRLLRDDEYPKRIGDLVAAAWAAVPAGGFEPVPPALRQWLARTLQLDPGRSFGSADEASAELDRVGEAIEFPGSPKSVDTFLDRYRAGEAGTGPLATPLTFAEPFVPPRASASPERSQTFADDGPTGPDAPWQPSDDAASVAAGLTLRPDAARPGAGEPLPEIGVPVPREADDTETGCLDEFQSESALPAVPGALPRVAIPPSDAEAAPSAPVQVEPLTASAFTVVVPAPEFQEDTALPPEALSRPAPPPTSSPVRRRGVLLAAAAAVIATVFGLAQWLSRAPLAPSTGTVAITTVPRGATAIIDGRPAGATPLSVTVSPGYHTVELQHGAESKVLSITVQAGSRFEQHVELPTAPADEVASGWVTVRAPLDLAVYEGDMLIGSTAAGRLSLPVGTHVLTLRQDALGFRTTRSISVVEGKSTPTTVELPNGLVRVLARPWADVWIDGKSLGRTPISNIPVPIGTHDVVVRHPELGEQRHQMTVSVNGLARLDVDLRRP